MIYSILIVVLGFFFGNLGALIGLGIGTYLNLWKEIWNDWHKKRGNAELFDFIATQTPLIITYLAYLL